MLEMPQTPPRRLAIREYLMTWVRPPFLKLDEGLREAKAWAELYSPVGREENGELVLEYAKDQYASLVTTIGELDKKADDLTRTILTVFGAVLAVASTRIVQVVSPWSILALFGLLVQAAGIVIAAVTRIPAELETPMETRRLMAVSDLDILPSKSQMQSVAAASYHIAIVGASILNGWKTTQLRRANCCFLAGLALLVLALLANYWAPQQARRGTEVKFELRTGSLPPGTGRPLHYPSRPAGPFGGSVGT
jgi:hypothetical protein